MLWRLRSQDNDKNFPYNRIKKGTAIQRNTEL